MLLYQSYRNCNVSAENYRIITWLSSDCWLTDKYSDTEWPDDGGNMPTPDDL
jgi:hypothetical protein